MGRQGAPSADQFQAQAPRSMSGATFDASALMALDRNDRRVIALLARAAELGARVTVPATALAQAVRNPSRQARLFRLLWQPKTALVALDGADATQVVLLLAASRTTDIADAHVVICARRNLEPIITSDPDDTPEAGPTSSAGRHLARPRAKRG
jgi:hypothetical protein